MRNRFDFSSQQLRNALLGALKKYSPLEVYQNPVILSVWLGTLALLIQALFKTYQHASVPFDWAMVGILAMTLFFANFAEAFAESRSQAQAGCLRQHQKEVLAKKLSGPDRHSAITMVPSTSLRKGDYVWVEAGDIIPADGEVTDGVASIDESAVTGESAPVIREAGGDFSSVTGCTRVLSDGLVFRVTVDPGESFLDQMIGMVENSSRQKTPNEKALNALLLGILILMIAVTLCLNPCVRFAGGEALSFSMLMAFFVCVAPTTIGGLLSAIGIAGMSELLNCNIIANSRRAIEAAGDLDVLLLDKTGTITLGNRQATRFWPLSHVGMRSLAEAAQMASLMDETPEGRSIRVLAKEQFNLRGYELQGAACVGIPFTAQTRMSGVDIGARQLRKGAYDAMVDFIQSAGAPVSKELKTIVDEVASQGSTPLVVSDGKQILGVVELKDIVKGGIQERFDALRKMGIKTIMITGDNPLTAAAIAAEAHVDDFLAQATPADKLKLIRDYQSQGKLVAMTGDGTNDAPALAQADVAVVMNSGTQAAKEAGNMVDLDSNPTKLIEIVYIGKQILMTRGLLTTFSIASDVAKYFALLPALFVGFNPSLKFLDVMHLSSPQNAILAATIFNAFTILLLLPLAFRKVAYRALSTHQLLWKSLLLYGGGGLLLPFIGIKFIDLGLSLL
jgi:K+-transporting ATPase ATPase B chain